MTNPVKKLYMPILSFLSGFEKLLRWNKRMAGKPIGYLLVFAGYIDFVVIEQPQ